MTRRPTCLSRASRPPALPEAGNNCPADISELEVRQGRAFGAGVDAAKHRSGEPQHGAELMPKAHPRRTGAGAQQHDGDVIFRQISRRPCGNFLEQRLNEIVARFGIHRFNDAQESFGAEHLPIGIARFGQGIGVAKDQVPHFQFDVKLLVIGYVENTQGNVGRRFVVAARFF